MTTSLTYSLADQCFARTKSIGIFNLSVQLVRRLADRPELERLLILSNTSLDEQLSGIRAIREKHDLAIKGKWGRMMWDQWGVCQAARRSGNEWLFLPKGFAPVVRRCPVKLASYVHDTMHQHYLEHYPTHFGRLEPRLFHRCLQANLQQASVLFVNSQFTREELTRFAKRFQLRQPPIVVAGIGFDAPPTDLAPKSDSIVVLTGSAPHKKTKLAVDFLSQWWDRQGYRGTVHWIGGLPEGLALPDRRGWHLHSRLKDVDYCGLVNQARVLVYFSEYEGFGMPPVEAVRQGVCPVYSDIPVTREVMGGLGAPFDNNSVDSFVKAMNRALNMSVDEIVCCREGLLRRHNWSAVTDRVVRALFNS